MTKTRSAAYLLGLVGTFGAVYVGVWTPLRVVCAAVGLSVAGWLIAHLLPANSLVARILDGVIAIVVVSVVLGLVLNYMPGGLTRHGFALGWCAVGVAMLYFASTGRTLPLPEGAAGGAISPRLVAACSLFVAAAAAAFLIADAGVRKGDNHPLLSLAALTYGNRMATIEVGSVHDQGIYKLAVLPDGHPQHADTSTPVALAASQSRVVALRLPAAHCFWTIELAGTNAPRQVRTLKLWVGTSSVGLMSRGRPSHPLAGIDGAQLPASCQARQP